MRRLYSIRTLMPALLLAFSAPFTPAGAQDNDDDDDVIIIDPGVVTPTPSYLVRATGNLFGNTRRTAPENWTLSFPNADASQYDALAAGVKTDVSPYSMPQMKDGTFSSSAKTLTRLEATVALADLGITDDVLAAYAERGMSFTLNFTCDAETSYTVLDQDQTPSVKFKATLLKADMKTSVGSEEANAYLSPVFPTSHLFGAASIATDETFRPAYVKLVIDMKPCDGMEDIADEGVSVGNVHMYVSTENIVTKNIVVNTDNSGYIIGEGSYVSLEEGQNRSTAHIVFNSNEKFTVAKLKDANGNTVATCNNRGDNRAVLPVAVTQALKTDYELTGTPSNPDYDPEDPDDDPDNGTTTLTLELEGVTPTAISGVKADNDATTAPKRIYNIAGQKVTTPQPGQIYIVDGKKGVVK